MKMQQTLLQKIPYILPRTRTSWEFNETMDSVSGSWHLEEVGCTAHILEDLHLQGTDV